MLIDRFKLGPRSTCSRTAECLRPHMCLGFRGLVGDRPPKSCPVTADGPWLPESKTLGTGRQEHTKRAGFETKVDVKRPRGGRFTP